MQRYFKNVKTKVDKLFEKYSPAMANKNRLKEYYHDNYGYSEFLNNQRYLTILMDINNTCNLHCIMCTRDSRNKQVVNMTPDEFKVVAGKCFQYAKKLVMPCTWEITLAKYGSETLRLLPAYEIPNIELYTNGNVMKDEFIESIFESGLTDLVFSFSEATPQTYSKIRRGGDHEKVLNHIRKVTQRKAQKRSSAPRIGVNLTCMKSNIEELPNFVRIVAAAGIEFVRGRHLILLEGLGMKEESLIDSMDKANDIIEEAREIAMKAKMGFDVPLLSKQVGKSYCYAPWTKIYISSEGDLTVCPRISQYEKIGNILEDEFEDIYYKGEAIKNLRKRFVDRDYNEVCGPCINGMVERVEISQKF